MGSYARERPPGSARFSFLARRIRIAHGVVGQRVDHARLGGFLLLQCLTLFLIGAPASVVCADVRWWLHEESTTGRRPFPSFVGELLDLLVDFFRSPAYCVLQPPQKSDVEDVGALGSLRLFRSRRVSDRVTGRSEDICLILASVWGQCATVTL